MHPPHVHATPYSGTWYPGDSATLTALLEALWRESEQRTCAYLTPGAHAFLVPHAGLDYSGAVAAAVYRHIQAARPARVIVAGFSHRGAPPGVWIPDVDAYATPLGEVLVDTEFAAALTSAPPFRRTAEERVCDHSVEIQLPLLQRAAPQAKIVPLYVSQLDADARGLAAQRLASLLAPDTLLIASSDLTHFGARFSYNPFSTSDAASGKLEALDHDVLDAVSSLDVALFLDTLRETGSTVCGVEPIALLLDTLREMESGGEIFQETLDYRTSGEISGDFHSSVSYGALAFFPYAALELDAAACRAVLDRARATLDAYHRTGRRHVTTLPPSGVAALERRAALFVSLHQDGHLRGCLGRTAAVQSIEGAVPELTLSAALEDSRFAPVDPAETGLEVEVSILSPMKRLASRSQLRAGVHGALLRAKGRQGLLLPQVASERRWRTDAFLQALEEKTGVRRDTARDPSSRLYAFRAQVIH